MTIRHCTRPLLCRYNLFNIYIIYFSHGNTYTTGGNRKRKWEQIISFIQKKKLKQTSFPLGGGVTVCGTIAPQKSEGPGFGS